MMNARIIPMSEEYKDKLTAYMHRKYPTFTDAYIQYDVNESIAPEESEAKSLLVVNDNDEIVGCNLYFITKAWFKGQENIVAWSHNTFLDEEYRRIIGMDFVLELASTKNSFGYSLTDINIKIQRRLKKIIFISGLRFFRAFNIWAAWGTVNKFVGRSPKIPDNMPQVIHALNETFTLCTNAKDIDIPNGGYWNKDICEVDFIRDEEFLNKRFFKNPVNKYFVYTNQKRDCYFVVRPKIHEGLLALQVVDFRYLPNKPQMANVIFKAMEAISMKLHAGIILFTTSDKQVKSLYESKNTCKSWPVAFICERKNVTSEDAYIIVNDADDDGEFH